MKDVQQRLEKYLATVLAQSTPPKIVSLRRSTEGFSQETFFFEVETAPGSPPRAFVAKRVPPAGLLEPYDLEPEFRVLHALGDDPFPSPPTPWFETDPAIFERPFYVMEHVAGRVPIPAPRANGDPPLSDAERAALAPQVVGALADLHAIDWRTRGFDFLGVPASPKDVAPRELARWEQRLSASGLAIPPVVAEALAWLSEAPPAADRVALVHGDFRLGNWLVDGEGAESRLSAVLDWEMVHLGDPIEDLAWCMSLLWRARTPFAAALLPPDDFLASYEKRAQQSVDRNALHWYAVLSIVKMASIQLTGIRAFLDGRSKDLRMAIFDHQLPFLCALLAVLRGWLPENLLEAD